MSSNTKKLIILTIVLLILSGLLRLLFGTSGFSLFHGNRISGSGNNWTVSDNFSDIDIETISAEVRFYTTGSRSAKIEWTGSNSTKLIVENNRQTLKIREESKYRWFFHSGFSAQRSEISIYLPQKNYHELEIETSAGKVTIPSGFSFEKAEIETGAASVDFRSDVGKELKIKAGAGNVSLASVRSAKDMKIETSAGRISLSDVDCEELSLKSNVGSMDLKNVIASEKMKIRGNVGSIELERCDGGSIDIKTDTGSVKGSLLTGKTFITKTDTGRISVPDTIGGECRIETDTGSINITVIRN